MTTTVERLRTTLAGLSLTAIDARLETLLESASKKEPSYGDFLLEVCRQRTEWSPLRDSELDNLFHEVHDLGVLDPFGDFIQQHRVRTFCPNSYGFRPKRSPRTQLRG
jgi:hypothetical protein